MAPAALFPSLCPRGPGRGCAAALLLLAAPAAALPSSSSATHARFAKSDAILGGASRLRLVSARQAGEALAEAAPTHSDARVEAPPVSSDRPDVFGSAALPVSHTGLDAQWRRVAGAGLEGTPGAWRTLVADTRSEPRLEQLGRVNRWVNTRILYAEDVRQGGRDDRWSPARETLSRGSGDCEDYAIVKMQLLRALGVPSNDLYITVVRDLVRRADHAVLVVRLDGRFMVLDSNTDALLDAGAVRDYRPIVSFAASGAWLHGYRRDVEVAALATGSAGAGGR